MSIAVSLEPVKDSSGTYIDWGLLGDGSCLRIMLLLKGLGLEELHV